MMFNEKYVLANIRRSIDNVKSRVYEKVCDLELEIYKSHEPLRYEDRMTGEYSKVCIGDKWGDLFDCAWFHCTAEVPKFAAGKKLVYVIDINGEGLIFDDGGCPMRGITNVNSGFDRAMGNPGKRIVQFCECAEGGEKADFWMDAGCNDLTGSYQGDGRIKEAYIASCNDRARKLFYDCIVLFTQAENTPEDDPIRYEIIDLLSRCHYILKDYSDAEIEECLALTGERLSRKGGDGTGMSLTAFGHAHIDLAWLWPIRETKRKGARTFATALDLMKRYPDYRFAASSPQLYEWVKQDYPQLYEKVKSAVSEGRWELLGAVWVESDCNLVSGESLVRQIIYGNAFYKKEFGKKCKFVWMPDTFGYSAAYPQILKKSGINGFATIKMSWNLINRFPLTNFRWRGIDGSEVAVHLPPEGNYVSEATPKSVKKAKRALAESGQHGEALLPFGIGDGGGGPSPCHLEYLSREKNLPGLCPIEQGTMSGFFERLNSRAEELPVYEGEMYLERHLGVYTSAAKNKKFNRKSELALQDAEMLCVFAEEKTGAEYPKEKLEEIWKEVLLYQFHDILPGSSIKRVYDESLERYAVLLDETEKIKLHAAKKLADNINTEGIASPAVVFNTLSFERSVLLETANGFKSVSVPANGYSTVSLEGGDELPFVSVCGTTLENEYIKAEFKATGELVSLYGKQLSREILKGESAVPLIYEDVENAWNLQYDYRNQQPHRLYASGFETASDGSFASVTFRYEYKDTSFTVSFSVRTDSSVLEAEVNADWHCRNEMLRFSFAPDVKTSKVTSEIQFGSIERDISRTTDESKAQIEISAHRWIALSKTGFNFALLNDCKYGYSVFDGKIELNALRGTDYPAKRLDEGEHTFRFGLYADCAADFAEIVREGKKFNTAPVIVKTDEHSGALPKADSFVDFESDNVFIDGIKKAEDGRGIIIRTYEACGADGNVLPKTKLGRKLCLCDLAENIQSEINEPYKYEPFEIVSYYLK